MAFTQLSLTSRHMQAMEKALTTSSVNSETVSRLRRLVSKPIKFKSETEIETTCPKEIAIQMVNQFRSFSKSGHDVTALIVDAKTWYSMYQTVKKTLKEDRSKWTKTEVDVGVRDQTVMAAMLPENGGNCFGGKATMFGGRAKAECI